MYSEEVLNRVREPRRVGTLPADDEDVGTGETGTLDEGTMTRIQVRVKGDTVTEARFKVFGCSAAIASASLVTEWLEGASLDEARAITPLRVVKVLELVPEREHVARMALDAAHLAIASVADRRLKAGSGRRS